MRGDEGTGGENPAEQEYLTARQAGEQTTGWSDSSSARQIPRELEAHQCGGLFSFELRQRGLGGTDTDVIQGSGNADTSVAAMNPDVIDIGTVLA